MVMKLLPKSEVSQRKVAEQRREADEGLKIARRVDHLRELHAEEEASLKAFREKTIAQIHHDTSEEQQKLDELKEATRSAETRLKELQKPLDNEWEEVWAESRRLEEKEETLARRETAIGERERSTEIANKDVFGVLSRSRTREEEASASLLRATERENATTLALQTAEKRLEEAEEIKKKAETEFRHRDLVASARERDVQIKEDRHNKEREDLDREWKLLADRKAMFERTIKRNQQ